MKHLLLLHGAIGAKDQLEPLAEKLGENFKVHLLNFSGHGGNPVSEVFSITSFAADVLDYLDDQKIDKVLIFGYSMGGYVALYLARHFADRVESVVTLATKFDWSPEIATREAKMLDPEKIIEKVPAFAAQLEHRHAPADWRLVLKKTAEMMERLGIQNTLTAEDLKLIDCPVLITIGDSDTMVSFEESRTAAQALANSEFLVLPATPHPIEKVEINRLAQEISRFLT